MKIIRLIVLIVLICFVQISYAINTKTPAPKNDRVTLIKNTVEQLDYLLEYNKSKSADHKKSDQWYIYIAGESLDSLKYYMNESTIIGFSDKYLKKLNDSLIQDIYSSFNVDEVIGDAIRDYASIATSKKIRDLEDNILEIATQTDIIVKSLSSNIKKQGANISLDVTIKGIDNPVRIQATLLEEINDGNKTVYRIVFVNNNKSLDNLESTLTASRLQVVDALEKGNVSSIVAKGVNADQHLNIQNKPIDIVDIEIRTVDANGKVISKKIGSKTGENSLNGAESWMDDIFNLQKSVVNQNKNIIANSSRNAKGAWGEMACDAFLTEKGFQPLHPRKSALTEG